jgi:hypothetical protein
MSTSPSWFDQEKFSRLVKKVGPKPVPEQAPAAPSGGEPENRSPIFPQDPITLPSLSLEKARNSSTVEAPAGTSSASTAHISLVSKRPSLLSEHRALPALPRRTAPLPALKALFQYNTPPHRPAEASTSEAPEKISTEVPPADRHDNGEAPDLTDENETGETAEGFSPMGEDLAAAWQKMTELNEELARVVQERDQALNEGILLRQQLSQADATIESHETHGTGEPSEELGRVTRERDEALAEGNVLREQLRQADGGAMEQDSPAQAKELSLVTEERDTARRDYAALREQFETLKQEQGPKPEPGENQSELKRQLEGFRLQLEKKNQELHTLKANPAAARTGAAADEAERHKHEVGSLREQLTRAKDEASVAQRGLALSQKALHETRDTLREATEGTSLSRHNFDNLKNECTTLVQQNTVLQAQNDQLARELAAAKSKLTTRL